MQQNTILDAAFVMHPRSTNSSMVTIGTSPALGIRGVLATTNISRGMIIERCPVLLYKVCHRAPILSTPIKQYYFEWDDDADALVFGYGSLYNHSYAANADYYRDYETNEMIFVAWRDIEAGEEITINYNGAPDIQDPIDPEYIESLNID